MALPRMYISVAVLLMLGLIGVVCVENRPTAGDHPMLVKLSIEPKTASFGTFDDRSIGPKRQSIEFAIHNYEAHDITVTRVQVGCGCIQTDFPEESKISTNGEMKFSALLNLASVAQGSHEFALTPIVNGKASVSAAIGYTFLPAVQASPSFIDFGEIIHGKDVSIPFKIYKSNPDSDVEGLRVEVDHPELVRILSFEGSGKEGWTGRLQTSDLPYGPFLGTISFRGGANQRRLGDANYRGEVVGSVKAVPNTVLVRAGETQKNDADRVVRFETSGKIEGISLPTMIPTIKMWLSDEPDTLHIRVLPGDSAFDKTVMLTVRADNESWPVPVRIVYVP